MITLVKMISDTVMGHLERLILLGLHSTSGYIILQQSILVCSVLNTGDGMQTLGRKPADQRTQI